MKNRSENGSIRLQTYLARAGISSRRRSEELILAGRVAVNGAVAARLGTRIVPGRDRVTVNGKETAPEGKRYIVLNKPAGYICSLADGHGRPLVTELLGSVPERIFPVGRLDLDSEGLLLLTNDGAFCHLMTHPRHRVEKTYRVSLARAADPLQVERLRGGVDIGDGRPPAAAKVRRLGPRKLEIVIGEGRKRQVRRMVEAVGNRVEVLKRTSVGPLRLERLRPGGWRDLTRGEIESLERCAGAIASGKNE